MTNHDTTRRAAVSLLKRGLASPAEVAELAGVSRQLVAYWVKNVDWKAARKNRISAEWARIAKLQNK